VLDSDGAQLIGYSPDAGRWRGWLMLDRILGHLDPTAMPYACEDENGETHVDEGEEYQRRVRETRDRLHQVGLPGHLAAPLAAQWASEAGYTPITEAVEHVLNGDEVFAEDLLLQLLKVWGCPALSMLNLEFPPPLPGPMPLGRKTPNSINVATSPSTAPPSTPTPSDANSMRPLSASIYPRTGLCSRHASTDTQPAPPTH
jgi:hypothetical protein